MYPRLRLLVIAGLFAAPPFFACATQRKPHSVALGRFHSVAYSRAGDPAGALPDESALSIRPLVVDGKIKEWTTGASHEITDHTFVVRRVLRINNELPGEDAKSVSKESRWVWQRGPWLLVERTTGRVTALKLPDYNPAVSQVMWFRDYGAYCGVTASGKSLYAVVAQVSVRKPVLAKKLVAYDAASSPACDAPQWQRKPMEITFLPAGKEPVSFQFVPGSAVLVEDTGDEDDTAAPAQAGQSVGGGNP